MDVVVADDPTTDAQAARERRPDGVHDVDVGRLEGREAAILGHREALAVLRGMP
jgi:hypothetical protein